MIKNYQVIDRSGKQLKTFRATEKQSKLLWSAMYDTEHTNLEELELSNLDDLVFLTDGDFTEVYQGDDILFTFLKNDDDTFNVIDVDTDEELMQLDIDQLRDFSGFEKYITCELCENSGYYTVLDSSSDGGRDEIVVCSCEEVKFKID